MSLLTFGVFGSTPVFALLNFGVAAGILACLLFILLRSRPLALFSIAIDIALGIIAIVEGYWVLGGLWILFSAIGIVSGTLNLYFNKRGAAWWLIASIIGLILAPIFSNGLLESIKVYIDKSYVSIFSYDGVTLGVEKGAEITQEIVDTNNFQVLLTALKTTIIPLVVFIIIGPLFGIIVPRIQFRRRKNERKHLTNTDPIIGQKIKIIQDAIGDRPARGQIGDVDWQVKPFFPYEKLKAGDIVKVKKIEGVTLLCVRDGKDMRQENKGKRKAEAERRHAEREANKVAEAKAILKENELAEENEKKTYAKSNSFNIISTIILILICVLVVIVSIAVKSFFPLGTIICVANIFIYILILFTYRLATRREPGQPKEEEEPKQEELFKVVEPVKEPVAEPVVEKKPVVKPAPVVEVKPEPIVAAKPKEKAEFVPFGVRMNKADKEIKAAYNELKSEVLSYGIKSRVSGTGDTFRLHTKEYVKMVIAGKGLKLYLALNPKDYKDSTFPFDDASKMVAHKETPFVFKVKSPLSVRRAKVLIGDCAKKDGLVQGEVVEHNHVKDLK